MCVWGEAAVSVKKVTFLGGPIKSVSLQAYVEGCLTSCYG